MVELLTCLTSLVLVAPPAQEPDTLQERVQAYVGALAEADLFSGSVLLARGGEVVASGAWGQAHVADGVPNTLETRHKLMSTSKPFTALTVMALVERGELALDDPLAELLVDWPERWVGVNLRHLLSHTSGIPNLESLLFSKPRAPGRQVAWGVLAPDLVGRTLRFTPGMEQRYGNFNYVLLGCVLEEVTGRPYPELVRDLVLEPAGMQHTGFDDGGRPQGLAMGYFLGEEGPEESAQDMSGIQAAGGLYSSVLDLHRLHRALSDGDLLAEETWRLMTDRVTEWMACGWSITPVHGRRCFHHSGGANGYVADFLHFPDDDACVVVLSNYAFTPVERVARDLAAILFGEPYRMPATVDGDALDACTGVYRAPGEEEHAMLVRRYGGTLMAFDVQPVQYPRGFLLVPLGPREYAFPFGGTHLTFEGEEPVPERLRYGALPMDRVAVGADPWGQAVGSYAVEGERPGSFELNREGDRLTMSVQGGWSGEMLVLPVSGTTALALIHPGLATLLRIDPSEPPRDDGARLTWRRPGGDDLFARRRD